MNKTTKGALAASAAAVLLAGGAGTLAFWTDTATVQGGSINSGTLGITPLVVAPNTQACDTNWVYATGSAKAGQTVVLFVPGDKVTKKCTFKIAATGDNLSAAVTAPATVPVTTTPAAASFSIDLGATYALSGVTTPRAIANGGTITSADNNGTLTATFLATIPFGTNETGTPKVNANDTKSINAALAGLTVSVAQTNPNP
ncbi:alternate-type signal peptide domain-containing protein [Nocardioides sp. C4-1]|uniref:alternate-type signal peptide domain-containing protein n=1 Tax=Nocardioides sp. C4-1 TaxID=3151851 RepID=UPI003262F19B